MLEILSRPGNLGGRSVTRGRDGEHAVVPWREAVLGSPTRWRLRRGSEKRPANRSRLGLDFDLEVRQPRGEPTDVRRVRDDGTGDRFDVLVRLGDAGALLNSVVVGDRQHERDQNEHDHPQGDSDGSPPSHPSRSIGGRGDRRRRGACYTPPGFHPPCARGMSWHGLPDSDTSASTFRISSAWSRSIATSWACRSPSRTGAWAPSSSAPIPTPSTTRSRSCA